MSRDNTQAILSENHLEDGTTLYVVDNIVLYKIVVGHNILIHFDKNSDGTNNLHIEQAAEKLGPVVAIVLISIGIALCFFWQLIIKFGFNF